MQGNLKEITGILGVEYSLAYRLHQQGILPTKKEHGRLIVDLDKAKRILSAFQKQEESPSIPCADNTTAR